MQDQRIAGYLIRGNLLTTLLHEMITIALMYP